MSSRDHALEKRRATLPSTETRVQELKVEAAVAAVALLVRGGNVFLDGVQQEQASRAAWDETHRRIAELDAETCAELKKLEAEMAPMKEYTQRFQLVIEAVQRGAARSEVMEKALARALEELALAR